MTDLRTLLHLGAPGPRRALDMAVVRRRSRRLRFQRVVVWAAGISAVAVLGIPVAGGLVASSGPHADVRVGPGPTTTTAAPDSATEDRSATVDATVLDPPSGSRARPEDRPGTDGPSTAPATAGERSPATTAPGAAAEVVVAGYPPAPACSVDNDGLGPGERRRCRFTATERGGARMTSSGPADPATVDVRGEVAVTRDGRTTTYQVPRNRARAGDLEVFVGCGQFIEPGDLVEVVVINGSGRQAATTTVGAGSGWAC